MNPYSRKLYSTTAFGAALLFAFDPHSAFAQSASTINSLGFLNGGGNSYAYGISADGNIVIGTAADGANGGAERAYRWTSSGGLQSLGLLNGGFGSAASDVSDDGSVIVGYANDGATGGQLRAFRWTQGGGMVSLGTINGGSHSYAYGVSDDGSAIAGVTRDGFIGDRAFRWTQGGGMVSLGVLNGGNYSSANDISGDGLVVVGEAQDGISGNYEAFRWDQGAGMVSLGYLNGGIYSTASDTNTDGSVVIGYADDGIAGATYAFRWTDTGGMIGLGGLNGGNLSIANGTNADGSVIVGYASDGANGNAQRGFRWSQDDGLQTVEDWFRSNGITVASDTTYSADAVSDDGTVVVGQLNNGSAYIARLLPRGTGIIDTTEFAKSLESTGTTATTSVTQADLHINGARSTPLQGLVAEGQSSVWVVADAGSRSGEGGTGYQRLAELGYNYGLRKNLQFGLGLGATGGRQELLFDGRVTQTGLYLAPEVLWNPISNLYLSALVHYHNGNTESHRGYDNLGTTDFSDGKTDTRTLAGRLRADLKDAFSLGDTRFTPNASYTHIDARMGAFTETGGGFPVHWNSYSDSTNTLRLGLDASHAVNPDTNLLFKLEGAYRFEDESEGASGQILGLNSFETSGISRRQGWLRAGFGAETKADNGVLSFMLNLTNESEERLDYWLSAGYRVRF